MENRPRTRQQGEKALMRRYSEWKKERESGSGGNMSSNSSKFGVIESSSDVNSRLGLAGRKSNIADNDANHNNVETSYENESAELGLSDRRNVRGVKRNNGDFSKFGNVGDVSGKKNLKSGLIGCKSKSIEKNKRGVKRNSDDFVVPRLDFRKNCKINGGIRGKGNVGRIRAGDDETDDDLDVIELKDEEEGHGSTQPVVELKRDKKHFTRSIKANQNVQFEVSDEKSEERAQSSNKKGVENPKKRKGFSQIEEGNNSVDEITDKIDDSNDDVQIRDVSNSSMVNSVCSSSGEEPSTNVVSNPDPSHFKEKDFVASPSQKRGGNGILEEWKSFGVSNQNKKHMRVTKNGKKGKKHVPVSDSSEESSESENISSSDSAYSSGSGEDPESSTDDEVVPSDDDNDCEKDDSFLVSHDSSSVREDEKVEEHEKKSRKEKISVELETMKGKLRESDETTSVARRLRPRRGTNANNKSKLDIDNDVMGTSSCPFTLSDDEIDLFPEEEDVSHREEIDSPEVRDNRDDTCKDTKEETKGKKKRGRPAKSVRGALKSDNKILVDSVCEKGGAELEKEDVGLRDTTVNHEFRDNGEDVYKDTEEENKGKKKRGRPPKGVRSAPVSVNKILVDSILEKGDAQLEKLVSPEKNPLAGVTTLPLKFTFEDSDTELSETSDIELEKLFEDMDYCMGVVNVGGSDSFMEDKENIPSKTNTDTVCGCLGGGSHHLVLDEQIGLRCTICHVVLKEISDILPDFCKHQGGRSDARDFYGVDYSNFGAVQIDDFTATQLHSFKHSVQAEGTVWDLVPGIRNSMYPHQQEGFEFIWKNIAGSIFIEKAKKSISDGSGSGCIISHAPGTGKTRLTIMFLQTYMQLNSNCRPLIIAPCSMLLTWEEEFRKWNVGIPFHNLNSPEYSGQESAAAVNLLKNDRRQRHDSDSMRLVKLFSWKTEKSVLGISYQLFEELANISVLIDRGKKEGKGKIKDNDTAGQIRKILLSLPGLLVLDEGHIPRNSDSQIWKALSKVQTERRIMLSGTPFQNNFDELLNTFCIVRPKFCDEIISHTPANGTEKRRRIKSAAKGKWAKMTDNIGKDDDQKLEELKKIISDFVHVYKGSILKEKLPGLRDFVVVLSLTNLQKNLIELVGNKSNNFFKRQHLRSLISVHPSLFPYNVLSEKESPLVRKDELERLRFDPSAGVKTKFLVELIKLSCTLKERVLIFSQYIPPLKFLMRLFKKKFNWAEGQEILYMAGEHGDKERQLSINKLNDPKSEARVLLASSRACSEGINLVGASRVVLLDVVWNPSITRQSTSRAYRLGQKKVVHVYHLIAGTWEWQKYAKQAGKDRISDLVFSSKDGTRKPDSSCSVAEDKILQDMVERMSSIFLKILNQPKESDLIDTFG